MIYPTILLLRNFLYKHNIKKSVKATVPTICVGNIAVGGAGKTPMTEFILRELLASDKWNGHHLAMLSRGYKRKSKGFQEVKIDSTANFAGDEPLQVKRKFPEVSVAVDKNRVEGCAILASMPEPAELVVLDDAFQYRKLKADMNIVLVSYNHPVNKAHFLPFGHLRDLRRRLREADIIVVTKCPSYLEDEERIDFAHTLGFKYYNPAKFIGTTSSGENQTVLFSTIRYGKSVPMFEDSDPRYIYSKKVALFSGIADDTPLRNTLSDSYKFVSRLRFSDHHRYVRSDFKRILSSIKANPTAAVATTEKDAQRVKDVKNIPQDLRKRMFYVPIETAFLTEEEETVFRNKLFSI